MKIFSGKWFSVGELNAGDVFTVLATAYIKVDSDTVTVSAPVKPDVNGQYSFAVKLIDGSFHAFDPETIVTPETSAVLNLKG